jgi:hypothetical protein
MERFACSHIQPSLPVCLQNEKPIQWIGIPSVDRMSQTLERKCAIAARPRGLVLYSRAIYCWTSRHSFSVGSDGIPSTSTVRINSEVDTATGTSIHSSNPLCSLPPLVLVLFLQWCVQLAVRLV